MDLAGVTNTVVVSYALSTTSTQLLLGVTVDFTPAGLGLNPNQTAIAEYLEAANTAGGGGLTPLLQSLLGITNPADYRGALDQLSPEIYLQTQTAALYASNDFTSTLLSCRVNGPDTASIIREGQCLWVGARARFTDSDDDFNNLGFTETAGLFSAGAQVALDRDWRLGFGVGYQTGTLEASTGASSDSDQVQGGVVLKYNPGALLLAAAATAGHSWNDVTRLGGSVKGDQDVDVYAGAVRVAYVFGAPGLYLKPSVDASATRLSSDGVDETGNGPANLIIRSGEQTVYTVSPTLEIGTEWRWSNGTLVRPFIRGGAIWYEGGDFSADSAFAAAPGGLGTFTIHHDIDDVMGTVAAGVELVNRDNAALRLSYEGQIGEQAEIHSIGLKGSAAF
jgi:outer membrane autotransporter protein